MNSTNPNKRGWSFPTIALAAGCAVLAVAWPGWRSELRAQTYDSPISNIIRSNFQFGRPTTQTAKNLRQMHNMKQIYEGSGNPSTSSLAGGAAGADQYKLSGDDGLFFGGGGSFGDVNTQRGMPGFNLYRRNATLGLDHRFSDKLTAGLFFNYVSSSANIAQNLGNFQSDIFRFIPTISVVPFDNAYIDLSAGYGYQQNHSHTNGTANFDGTEYFGSVDFGYSYNVGSWTITGYGQGSAFGMNVDSFREAVVAMLLN